MTPRNQTGINDKMKRLLTPDQSAAPFGFSATTFDSRHLIYSINVIEQTYSSTLISFRLVRSNLSPSGEGITSTLSPSVVTFSIISICFSVNFFSFLPIKTTYSQDRLSPPTRYSCEKIMSIAELCFAKIFLPHSLNHFSFRSSEPFNIICKHCHCIRNIIMFVFAGHRI